MEHPNPPGGQLQRNLTVGRSRRCDIRISSAHDTVSGVHARLCRTDAGWEIQDIDSSNGTFVNDHGSPVRRALLRKGDTVYLGESAFAAESLIAQAESALRGASGPMPDCVSSYLIGRSRRCRIRFDYPHVSKQHARLMRSSDGRWFIEDLGSRHGTSVNAPRNRILGRVPLNIRRDVVYFGNFKIRVSRLVSKIGGAPRQMGSLSVSLPQDRASVVGRSDGADVTIDYPQISSRHARMTPMGSGAWLIEDLGSRNGTYVNGRRVKKAVLTQADRVSLGGYILAVSEGNTLQAREMRGDTRLDADGLCLEVPKTGRRVLDEITFTVYPSEFVGLMGPSGCGKTTLIMTLSGILKPSQGCGMINGLDLYANFSQFRGTICYMPQDDILHNELTVRQCLWYAARLRLPPDTVAEEIDERIDTVLRRLQLLCPERGVDLRDQVIGSVRKKGISGGERKRVSLAISLLTDPAILLLDEPTSGLSSVDARLVMDVLHDLSAEGRIVIATLHQPDLDSFKKLDNVIVLNEGQLAYYGPAWPDSLLYFNTGMPSEEVVTQPESGLVGMSRQPAQAWRGLYERSNVRREYVGNRRDDTVFIDSGDKTNRGLGNGFFDLRQWWLLARRALAMKFADRENTLFLLLQAPLLALLIGLVFKGGHSPHLTLYMLVLAALWLGTANAAREIVCEQAIYRFERISGLGIGEYVLSKMAVLVLLALLQCLMLTGIVLLLAGVMTPWWKLYGLLLLCSLAGSGLGLCLSAAVHTQAAAQTLVPLALLPMIILGGGLMPLPEMHVKPVFYASQAMPSRWGYEVAILWEAPLVKPSVEDVSMLETLKRIRDAKSLKRLEGVLGKRLGDRAPKIQEQIGRLYEERSMNLEQRILGEHVQGVKFCCLMLGGYALFFIAGAVIVLKLRDSA